MKSCRILWSTQSGRAKACARRTKRVLSEKTNVGIQDVGSSFDETPEPFLELISNMEVDTFLLLFVSTTGDGEHCDSIRDTWKTLLSKTLLKNSLQGKKFAIFCLGDRAYGPQFCAAGRKLAVRLLQLGMANCCEVGYGDDNTPSGGVFRDLDDWLEASLLPILEKSDTDPSARESVPSSPFQCCQSSTVERSSGMHAEWREAHFQKAYQEYFALSCPVTAYRYSERTERIIESKEIKSKVAPLLGAIVSNERITAVDWEQETRHIRIQLQNTDSEIVDDATLDLCPLPYQAGDIASIMPFNSDDSVKHFLAVLPHRIQDMADHLLELKIDLDVMNNSFTHWPQQFTLRGWLKHCADIHSLPEREDLRALSVYCSDEHPMGKEQREKLQSLSETAEAALYGDYVLREKRSWGDVIYDFESLSVESSGLSVEALLTLLPPMRPRDFSIASAPSSGSKSEQLPGFSVELCVAVVKGKTRLGRQYHGLCSEFLSRMTPKTGEEPPLLQVWIRPGSFGKLPLTVRSDTGGVTFETPILCVGAGTGVAPMRSLLQERTAVARSCGATISTTGNDHCRNILLFGCRKSSADYYYKDEWLQLENQGQLRLLTAFSRDQFQKIYVQKVLRDADNGTLIAKHLLELNGALYIAGGPKMARAVKEEIVEALSAELPGCEKDAKAFLNKLQRMGKFSIEAWS